MTNFTAEYTSSFYMLILYLACVCVSVCVCVCVCVHARMRAHTHTEVWFKRRPLTNFSTMSLKNVEELKPNV